MGRFGAGLFSGMIRSVLAGSILGALAIMPAQAQTKIAIGTAKDPNLAAQLTIARDKGFFKDVGLDATISDFPSGGDMMAAFVSGSVQMATVGSTPLITLAARPYPIAILAQVSDISGAQQLVVRTDVNAPEELYGKKVGLLKGTAPEAFFNSIIRDYGLDGSKFEIVNLGAADMMQALLRNQIAAAALWEPHSTRLCATGQGKVLISGTRSFIPGKEGPKRVYGDHAVLFTSRDFAREHGDTVRKVIAALARANDYLRTDRKAAAEILAAAFQLTPAQMETILEENDYTLAIDDQMVADMNMLGQFLASLGKIPKDIDAKSWIDPDPLRSVAPDLVRFKRPVL
jgi:NitT/TauT family transport system substrate-binding protein